MGEQCEECGKQIESHQIRALPYSTMCKECAKLKISCIH
ncbi:TraR/DksA C4-type zinc finger protein [Vreelandella titanicae]